MVERNVEFGDPPKLKDGFKALVVCVVAFLLGCLCAGL